MEAPKTKKVPQNLQLAVILSCGLTIAVSTVYLVLSLIALVYRLPCDDEEFGIAPVNLFMKAIHRVYIQDDSCDSYEIPEGLTTSHTVFILVILTLTTSVLSCIAAIVFLVFVSKEHKLLHATGYVYIAMFVCTLTVDLTLGVQFGMDFTTLTDRLIYVTDIAFAYPMDSLRLGTLFLLTVTLKGFVAYMVNITLIILIIVYLQQYSEVLTKAEHPIHNMGVLNAYDTPKREWEQRRDMYNSTFASVPHLNQGYNDDDYITHRNPPRDNQRQDFHSRAYEHSDSWQHSGNNQNSLGSSRPFTYLEEPPRTPKAPSPSVEPPWRAPKSSSPSVETPWRSNWTNPPPVPAPDYSPQPRRLKSALKPGYM